MSEIFYVDYENEKMLSDIQILVSRDLSEPYSVFTYRYFLHNWPELCICAFVKNEAAEMEMIGTVVSKAEMENGIMKGYLAMLTVVSPYRKQGIGRKLAVMGLERMVKAGCSEIVLETELSNTGAIFLYEKLGFIKEDRLAKYYLNGGDAFRLRLMLGDDGDDVCAEKEEDTDDDMLLSEKLATVSVK